MSLISPIVINNVCYHASSHALVEDVSATLPVGTLTCICGSNGSGKSTLAKLIVGLIHPTEGSILIGGYTPTDAVKKLRIGYVPQASALHGAKNFPATVSDVVHSGLPHATHKQIYAALASLGAEHILNAPINQLSGGEIQRTLIARALIAQPDVLVLDEPTAGLDQIGTEVVYRRLHALCTDHNTTVIVIEHELDIVEHHADLVIALATKQLGFGTPRETLALLSHTQPQHHAHT